MGFSWFSLSEYESVSPKSPSRRGGLVDLYRGILQENGKYKILHNFQLYVTKSFIIFHSSLGSHTSKK